MKDVSSTVIFLIIWALICGYVASCGGCSGRGECMTIGQIYEYRQLNSGLTSLTTYTPWEKNHTTACVCDFGYSGPSCEYVLCPKGDDPMTVSSGYPTVELALSTPEGTSGITGFILLNYLGFSFSFKPQNSWNATNCNASFDSLPNVGTVNCTIIYSSVIRTVYAVQFLEFARMPYENNIYYTDGQMSLFNSNPPLNEMNCDTSQLNGTYASIITCDVSLQHSNVTYPGKRKFSVIFIL